MANTSAAPANFTTLQAGRAIAALLVVLYHNSAYIFALEKYWGNDPADGFFTFAHAGVNFFFVLSGFIIYHIHNTDIGYRSRLTHFVKKRFIRIYPIYWLILAAIIPIYFIVPSFGHEYHRSPTIILSSFTLIYLDEELRSALGVAWTLYHEIFFYCLFALAIAHKRLGFTVIALWFVSCIGTFAVASPTFPLNFIAMPINLLFGMGMLACYLFQHHTLPAPKILALLGLSLFAGAGYDENVVQLLSKDLRDLVYGMGSMLMIMGLVECERAGQWKAPTLLQKIGDASYSIYLTHFTLLSLIAKIFIKLGALTALPIMLSYILLPLITILIGMLFHRFVERPLLKKANQWMFKK